MSLLHPTLRTFYAGIRRLAILDVKRLMYLPPAAAPATLAVADGYRLSILDEPQFKAQLQLQLQQPQDPVPLSPVAAGLQASAAEAIRAEASLVEGRQAVVAAWQGTQLVAYVYLAHAWVPAAENFSRSRHLGTSLRLPAGTFFAHTAYTFAPHRGRRLLGAMLSWFADSQRDKHNGSSRPGLFATMDWTNEGSRRAFARLGFEPLGLIWRMGRGPLQASLYPAAASEVGLLVADDARGWRLAIR